MTHELSIIMIHEYHDSDLAINCLQALERLDLTNNSLSTLPFSLGTLPNLKSLPIEGNPMKAIRRDIIQRGTVGLLKYLGRDSIDFLPPK